ncbi:Spindle and kinetochore-associated protein 2 [Popillia japonica]|uniref:Spindle and kinetochore-associated protein 2 n=1 Tax=Popillia japonica TaxID=7064 RepID=A0AAW1NAH9_POPJA
MEVAVEDLEKQMQKTDAKLDSLAVQVGNIENEIFSEDGTHIEVCTLLKSVNEVKNNYQNLHKEIQEVQGLQKELSSKLQGQLLLMQKKCNLLKEKLCIKLPDKQQTTNPPRLILSPTSSGQNTD